MKIPLKPPTYQNIIVEAMEIGSKAQSRARFLEIMGLGPVDSKGRYLHWDELRHKPAPEGLSHEQWWAGMKVARNSSFANVPFQCKYGKPFKFCIPNDLQRSLHWLDLNTSGTMVGDGISSTKGTRDTYLIKNLVEEAISSSQLEGASTTRNVAKEMIRQERQPRDTDEQMIYNNYYAMKHIRDVKEDPLSPELIRGLHEILTEDTLDDPKKAGAFRDQGDDIKVVGGNNVVLHIPPKYDELNDRIVGLCNFANESDGEFIHPVVRAIIIHFMLAYDHPFVDGNGRTARALFYWVMANQGYWMMAFISISRILKMAPVKYGRAFLYTETDDNDLTYFIYHQVETIVKAVKDLHKYLDEKKRGIESAENLLQQNQRLKSRLNFRQLDILRHALKHPRHIYKIAEHQNSHGIGRETARKDLLEMSDELKLLTRMKEGRSYVFMSPSDLSERITNN